MIDNKKFIELQPGTYYEIETGLPWTSKKLVGGKIKWTITDDLQRITCKDSLGYYKIGVGNETIMWHKLVWEKLKGKIPEGMVVDHKDNNPSNNKLDNLQLVTHKDNIRFCKKYKNNKSGFPGVRRYKDMEKWSAEIRVDCKTMFLGYFRSPEEAYRTYLDAKKKYHGKESLRSLKDA